MESLKNKQIAIIGAGPAGLTLARLLQIKGMNVTVYERDAHEHARPKGATLDLHDESGLRAIREAGLWDAFEANYRPGADLMKIVDASGTVLFDDHTAEASNRDRPEIDRGPLQKILLESLDPGTVKWGTHFLSLEQSGEGWNILFKNRNKVYADLVIAADGAHSKLRPYITSVKALYSGITIVEGAVHNAAEKVPELAALLQGGKIFALGHSQSLIISSKGDGSLVFYTGHKTDEHWVKDSGIDFADKAAVIDWFRRDFAGWDKRWLPLFEQADLPFTPRPQYCMPFDQHWPALSNITMIGDAAHLMPPYAGEGVNMAMLDAVELADCLTSDQYPDTLSAISTYETAMRQRAAEVAQQTMDSTKALHSSGAIDWMTSIVG